MSKNIETLTKWIPPDIKHNANDFGQCQELRKISVEVSLQICNFLTHLKMLDVHTIYRIACDKENIFRELEEVCSSTTTLEAKFGFTFDKLQQMKHLEIIADKVKMWKRILWVEKLKVTYNLQELIRGIASFFVHYGENLLKITLKLSSAYNSLISFDFVYKLDKNISICNNTCPYLMFPQRKISITRLLQILAQNRVEICCHKLIDCLLETYKQFESENDESDDESDNSSIEIYRALTKHMSPIKNTDIAKGNEKAVLNTNEPEGFPNLEGMIAYEEQNVIILLENVLTIVPAMFGNEGIKKCKATGESKISSKARQKVIEYYEQILWGEVGNCLEHIILWWAPSPLALRPPHSSQHLREWIIQFIPTADIPPVIVAALSCLADALGVHVASTSWDLHFRLALVGAKLTNNSDTGKLFCNTLQDLAMLSNQCESTIDWIIGAPLDELPLVEQIPVLHRLDHTIHTTRLWVVNQCKKLANEWNVEAFFLITNCDIENCLTHLKYLKMADHTIEIEKGGLGVHVQVCALMRAKLVSEINVNVLKLKNTPLECVDGLAAICRTISLASLQMIFPHNSYWRQPGTDMPEEASPYVAKYLEQILSPVLTATDQHTICNMILKIMCEAWLDHIYINKIHFSQYGAIQLLCDFAQVSLWLTNCPKLNETMRKKMLKNEVLRRCEGVGRLLLRFPGEHLKMVDKTKKISTEDSDNTELMPPEMYVPNQEQWLELRAVKRRNLFTLPICCEKL